MNKNIFRAYDIRGNSKTDLDQATIRKIGYVLGKRIRCNHDDSVYVGHDSRLSAQVIQDALVTGFNAAGVRVLLLGLVPTPMVYYATKIGVTPNGVMITGSHNPKDDNGLKIVINDKPVSGEELLAEVEEQSDVESLEKNSEEIDFCSHYQKEINEKFKLKKVIKIVLDAGNGAAGILADNVFISQGFETISINKQPDGNFPNHHPDPSKEKNLEQLKRAVLDNQADMGFAFDGDGDRVGVITNNGKSVLADHLIMILSKHYLEKKKGAVIFDVKCSSQLPILIKKYGGTPIMEKTGHFNIKNAIKKHDAVLGGEMSGHIFINHEWYGFDDAIYTALIIAKIVSDDHGTVSSIIEQFPKTFSTPELNLDVDDEEKFSMVEKFKKEMQFPYGELNTVDGVRISIGNSWGLMRASNTSAKLVFRFEAESKKDLEYIRDLFENNLRNIFPEIELDFN
ncbi:MAG: phosphomannomutase/phosphoglucomutase [Gammaproteobacteria bacterium TMED112]|nr:MAG: phosphomannomutase/phosphoglucomutase [Gammaproteobacteria bacterium TMED112]|tara:strand:+ start:2980 stop:4341 length:1362 start_codon:yes stop_codon:yes gene_type:complete